MPHLSETFQFLQSLSFWEARRALIGQLSSALWMALSFVASSGDIITDYNDL